MLRYHLRVTTNQSREIESLIERAILWQYLLSLAGRQLTVFNSQSTIQVGGRWNRNKGRVERSFLGIIAGLVVNGARILELAAAKDGRIITRGDVQLLPPGSLLDRAAPLQRMQQVIKFPTIFYAVVGQGNYAHDDGCLEN